MPSHDAHPAAHRRSAAELIDAIVVNMRANIEDLRYSRMAPSRHIVYLHPTEFARLEGILPIVQQQTVRALTEEVDTLNRRSWWHRYAVGVLAAPQVPVETAGVEWLVEFTCDADGELGEGDLAIDWELRVPADPELGIGERTRRVTTRISSHGTSSQEWPAERPTEALRAVAKLVYDDNTGPHSYDVVKDSLTIGRGGIACPVDVRIVSSVDVSREHVRIRRETSTGQFFLTDLSSLGTTLDGRHVPRGYDEADGARRENGRETPVPDGARIGLAEMVYLHFRIVG
jgi:hypothetical protein